MTTILSHPAPAAGPITARTVLEATPSFYGRPRDWNWNRSDAAASTLGTMEKTDHSVLMANEDKRLMVQIAQGDRAAFAILYDRFSTPLYSLAIRMLANEAEAQDLLQEVFLSLWNKASSFQDDRGSAFSWMVTQLRNRAIDRIRSRHRHGRLLEARGSDLEPSGSATMSSSDQCELSERGRQVRAALGELSKEQYQVLRLAYFEGLTQVEIAEKLKEPLGTIKARAYRGIARLRVILGFLHE